MLVVIVSMTFVFSYGVSASVNKYENPVVGWDGLWHAYGFSGNAAANFDAASGDIKIAGVVGAVAAPSANIGYYQYSTEFDVETPGVSMFIRGMWLNTADWFSTITNYLNGIFVLPKEDTIEIIFGTGTSLVVHSFEAPEGYSLDEIITITIKDNSEAIFVYANDILVCAIDLNGTKTLEGTEYYESVVLIKPSGEVVATISDALVAKTGNHVGYVANVDGSRANVKSYTLNSETFDDTLPTLPETENPTTSDNFVIGFFFIALVLLSVLAKKKLIA